MNIVTVTSDFRIEIPPVIREGLGIRAGDQFRMVAFADRIELRKQKPISEMDGLLSGIDAEIISENAQIERNE